MSLSPNMQSIFASLSLMDQMRHLVEIYERGTVNIYNDLDYDLSAQQITSLKQDFAAARNECISELNSITG